MAANRKGFFLRAFVLTGLLSGIGCASHGRAVVYVPSRPPLGMRETIVVSPGPGYVWIPGYHRWDRGNYVWVQGRWDRPPRTHARWVPGRWRHNRHGWFWVEGHWR